MLRDGRVVTTLDPREASDRAIAALIVSAKVGEVKHRAQPAGGEALAVRGLTLPAGSPHELDP